MCCDTLRLGSRLGEETGCPCMPDVSFERRDCFVDSRADEWVNEPQRRLWAQDTDSRESAGGGGGRLQVQVGKRGRMAWIGVVAEDRDRLRKAPRLGRKAGQANGDGPRAGTRPELAQARYVRPGRFQTLIGDGVHK